MKKIISFLLMCMLFLSLSACTQSIESSGGTESPVVQDEPEVWDEVDLMDVLENYSHFAESTYGDKYRRFDFTLNGRSATVILPETFTKNNPWAWRAEFLGAFDTVDLALLADGWALAYYSVSNMYGNPESIELMKAFYDQIVFDLELHENPVLFGFSRGGLYTVNFAVAYPEIARCIYLDAPVMDVNTWPRESEPGLWQQLLKCYGKTEETISEVTFPVDRAADLVAGNVAVMLVAGDSDKTVPYDRNGQPFAEAFESLGGTISVIVKPGCDHHPHSVEDPTPVVDFIKTHFEGK